MIRGALLVLVFSFLHGFSPERMADVTTKTGRAESCSACHGAEGISDDALIPSLAGQRAPYIVSTLQKFKKGTRKNPVMNQIAAGLSRTDMESLAAYFSGLRPMTSKGDPEFATKGTVSYVFCQGCHGPFGAGNEANPRLAGQHAAYQLAQLKAYKKGTRKHPVMSGLAGALGEEDMQALAEYLATLK